MTYIYNLQNTNIVNFPVAYYTICIIGKIQYNFSLLSISKFNLNVIYINIEKYYK